MKNVDNAVKEQDFIPVAKALLPVIFVLDCSTSMGNEVSPQEGTPISILNQSMEDIISFMQDFSNSNADALLKVGVLQVHDGADWLQPGGLEELDHFVYTPLKANGLTDMGEALTELYDKLSREEFLASTTGWFKPIIIFLTDGCPTDNWKTPLRKLMLQSRWYSHAIKVGFAVGEHANAEIIAEIVGSHEAVIKPENFDDFRKKFRKLAADSITEGSKSRGSQTDTVDGATLVKRVNDGFNEQSTAKTDNGLDDKVTYPNPDPSDSNWGEGHLDSNKTGNSVDPNNFA